MESPVAPAPLPAPDAIQRFGTFHLGEFELALPIGALQEVVPFPAAIARIPLAPAHLLGLIDLRGMLLPVVHLGRLLGLAEEGDRAGSRIAIVACGDVRLGVLFERTGEMLRLPAGQVVPFRHDGEAPALIEGAFRAGPDGRILQVLGAAALARLPGVPQALNPDLAEQARQRRAAQGRRRQAVSFRAGGRPMALPMAAIHEIIRLPALEHSVLADGRCLGRVHLRGQPVPVIDFARFLDLPGAAAPPPEAGEDLRRVLVLRQDEAFLGLLVDEVDGIVGHLDAELLPMPAIEGQAGLFAGCIGREDGDDLMLVDAPALHADPLMAHLARGHRDLYLAADGEADAGRGPRRGRETWVTFRLDRLMAVRIEQLCEVIDADPSLVRPPGAPAHVCGVLNLRQRLVPVVDLRTLYGMAPADDPATAKLLVVERDGQKVALVVDAVQDIVGIERGDTLRIPSLVAHRLHPELRRDLREVVDLPDGATVMLLDAASLLQRLGGAAAAQRAPARVQTAT